MTVTERSSHFDGADATKGIIINAVDAKITRYQMLTKSAVGLLLKMIATTTIRIRIRQQLSLKRMQTTHLLYPILIRREMLMTALMFRVKTIRINSQSIRQVRQVH